LRGLSRIPEGQKRVVRIEDIGRSGVIDGLEEFSGRTIVEREAATRKINANPSYDLPQKEEWTKKMNHEFNEIAEGMMWFFGYG
jgi:hypothetical protein